MKSFLNFFSEARVTRAAQEAKRKGLTYQDGYWVDRSGKRVARTENGELKILSRERLHRRRNPPKRENQNLKVRFNRKRPGGEVEQPKEKRKGKI